MPSKLFIPNDVIDKMRCVICSNYLSIFPVYLLEDEKGAVCGRCQVVKTDNTIRDEAYENIAQFLMFPCCYNSNGCEVALGPAKLQEHEVTCKFRKFECPSKHYTKCQWEGPSNELVKHFEETHEELLINNSEFEVGFTTSSKENRLLQHENMLFVVTVEIDSRKNSLWCSVRNLSMDDNSNNYNYRLKFSSENHNYFHRYCERQTTSLIEENITKVNGEFIQEQLNDPQTIIAHIEIFKANLKPEEKLEVKEKRNPNVNFEILSELECPVCTEYMLPPIYQCVGGHSICFTCKSKVETCPLCKDSIQDKQNYVLEKMTTYLTYPCKYYESGCIYAAKASNIRDHEKACSYGPYNCPLEEIAECKWKASITEVVTHVQTKHTNYLLETDKINVSWTNDNNSQEDCYLIKFSSELFKLYYKYENNKFYWSMQFVGPFEKSKLYKYELDFVDNSGENLRYFMRGKCVPLSSNADCFKTAGTFSMLYLEQIKSYIVKSLSYRVRIYKE